MWGTCSVLGKYYGAYKDELDKNNLKDRTQEERKMYVSEGEVQV